ncbi:hypothetical protein HYT56_04960 [Candidatus Woesearchaeota archaeon]|nr:hypothetical protein [Candidatus Woesearchaeota archaeon]
MVIDEREVVALFDKDGRLRKEVEKDIKAIAPRKVTEIFVKKIKDGFTIVFDSNGNESSVSIGLKSVRQIAERVRSKDESVRITFSVGARDTGPSMSQEIKVDIKESDWTKKGVGIIKSEILDFVKDAIKQRFIFSR